MKEKWRDLKNKKVFLGLGILLILLIGVTIAYFSSYDEIANRFRTKRYDSKTTEVFTSPNDWKPGDTTAKNLKVTNTGNVCENVRVHYTEEWISENGDPLPSMQNGNNVGIVNKANLQDWVQDGNYFYYNKDLMTGETTSSFIRSVTYNKLAVNDFECFTNMDNERVCSSSGDGYDGATYTLTLHVETIQCSLSERIWGVDISELENEYSIAIFDIGENVNAKIKTLAAGTSTSYSATNNTITAFKRASSLPSGFVPAIENTISSSTSDEDIYAWFDNGTIFFYSEAEEIKFNATSSYFFYNCKALNNIEDIEYTDASYVKTFYGMFEFCQGLTSISPLSSWQIGKSLNTNESVNCESLFYYCTHVTSLSALSSWDTSKVHNMQFMFSGCSNITSLSPLSNWNTSKVTSMSGMFYGCSGLTTLTEISDWKTSKVEGMDSMFYNCTGITSLSPLSNWNTSNVNRMSNMFFNCTSITSLSSLSSWNTSKVKNMSSMFRGCSGLTTLLGIGGWDVSKVENMEYMFDSCTGLTNLTAISGWNTGAVTKMRNMFFNCTSLTDASAINGWNISAVTYTSNTSSENGFYDMFWNCNVHPTFTNRSGTWDSNGSFIPTT